VAALTWAALSGPADCRWRSSRASNGLVAKLLQRPELLKPLAQDILEIKIMTPEQITAHFKDEVAVWTPVVASFRAKQQR
jgi:tripartite-type tricarboxylate transporter receptor subunit TctC